MISGYILYYRGPGVRIEHDSCQLLQFDRVHRDVIDTKLSGQQPVWPRGPTVSFAYGGRGCNYWIAYKRRCSKLIFQVKSDFVPPRNPQNVANRETQNAMECTLQKGKLYQI